jgi:hypothetical protein
LISQGLARTLFALPRNLTRNVNAVYDTFRPINHLLVLENFSVYQHPRLIRLPAIECVGVNEHHVGARTDIQATRVETKGFRWILGQSLYDLGNRLLSVFSRELQGHEIAVKKGHVGNVCPRIVKPGERVFVEQKLQSGSITRVCHIRIKTETFVVRSQHVKRKISVISQLDLDSLKSLLL